VFRGSLPLSASLLFGVPGGCGRSCSHQDVLGLETGGIRRAISVNGIDCPDGLARCRESYVEVSRLATIEQPCRGSAKQCVCPWERITWCPSGCVAERVEVVAEPDAASRQLCAPQADAGRIARSTGAPAPQTSCEEGQLFRCTRGVVVACRGGAPNAACLHDCFAEGAALNDDEPVTEWAATAILCAR
jgi:hypothetical protein